MNGVRKVERLDPDGQLFVSLTEEVDLDDLLLHLLTEPAPGVLWDADDPSSLGWDTRSEVAVGRYRNVPCFCGEGHTYDVTPVEDGASTRGSYLGVMTR